MGHIISASDLCGDYDYLIATSTGDSKRLVIRTTVAETSITTVLVVMAKGVSTNYGNIEDAVDAYNKISK